MGKIAICVAGVLALSMGAVSQAGELREYYQKHEGKCYARPTIGWKELNHLLWIVESRSTDKQDVLCYQAGEVWNKLKDVDVITLDDDTISPTRIIINDDGVEKIINYTFGATK